MTWLIWLICGLVIVAAAVAWYVLLMFRRWRKPLPVPSYRAPAASPSLADFPDDDVTVCWVGHSTVYINFYGIRILTDPVFSERVGLNLLRLITIGVRRHTAPALDIADVAGNVDVIMLSHAHMDHFDMPSLRRLQDAHTQVVTATGTSSLLHRLTFRSVMELGGNDQVALDNGLLVQAVPVRHWGSRYPWNRGYGYTGYLLSYQGVRLFFAGDTAYTPDFVDLRSGGPIELAFFPIGAYSPASYESNHCTPEQAWQMFEDCGARFIAPIHWDTFVLSREPVDEPFRRLLAAATDETRIVWREHGDVFTLHQRKDG